MHYGYGRRLQTVAADNVRLDSESVDLSSHQAATGIPVHLVIEKAALRIQVAD